MYVFLNCFLIDFDMEKKVYFFLLLSLLFFLKQREKGTVTTNDTDH